MKRTIIILSILSLVLVSCQRDPVASFIVDEVTVLTGDEVYFTNTSLDASGFEWDFGDGTYSNEPNVRHYWDVARDYDVRLTVWSKSGKQKDVAYQTISVLEPAILEVEVAEWNIDYVIEYIVPDASVRLYPTWQDWKNESNMVDEKFTNVNGLVVFDRLFPGVYYVDVYEDLYDNYELAEDDPGFVTTEFIYGGQVNYFLAWADYYGQKGLVPAERSREFDGVTTGRVVTEKSRSPFKTGELKSRK